MIRRRADYNEGTVTSLPDKGSRESERLASGARRLVLNLTQTNEYWVLGCMMLLLHLSLWSDFATPLSASLMLAHLGLFMLWQPIWRRDQNLDLFGTIIFFVFTLGFVIWLSWWITFLWLCLLIGLVSGRNVGETYERYAYLGTLVLLISELLIKSTPGLFSLPALSAAIDALFKYGLLVIPLGILFVPFDPSKPVASGGVDFFRGMAVALMCAMLAFGSLLIMYHSDVDYPVALSQSLVALALFLLLISWLLSPHAGFSGFTQLWERSLLNIGTPFEQWLTELSLLAAQRKTPPEFLTAAMQQLVMVHWIMGVRWSTGDEVQSIGVPSAHEVELPASTVTAYISTRRPIGPTLLLHCKLLVELLNHFHEAKLREQELAQRAHLQAIYETGARVTHDIKNLLQSLQTITGAIGQERVSRPRTERRVGSQKAQRLFERQIPHITQRLQLALDKLQAPEEAPAALTPVQDWWASLLARNEDENTIYEADITQNTPVPTELFDSVVENLLENARHKRATQTDLVIKVELTVGAGELTLAVSDTGAALSIDKAADLGKQPVASDTGLGIGLYQATRQAELLGYKLTLTNNEAGQVRFELGRNSSGVDEEPQYRLL